jgi:hypothetical protein
MPYSTPVASYSTTVDGTYTALTGIQTISVNRGRQRFQDPFSQSSCVIELIPANSYATALAVGQYIDVRDSNSASSPSYFVGRITDVNRSFDMPYNSGTGAAPGDRITIFATGGTGVIGAKLYNNASFGSGPTQIYEGIVTQQSGARAIICLPDAATFGYVTPAASAVSNYSGSALDLVNKYLRTDQLLLDDYDSKRSSYLGWSTFTTIAPLAYDTSTYAFTDNTSSGKYVGIDYMSSVQNSFDVVQVAPAGLAIQTATLSSSIDNTLRYDTINNTTTDALSLANFILATNNQPTAVPFAITTNTLVDSTCLTLAKIPRPSGAVLDAPANFPIGSTATIAFRGTNVSGTVQGVQTTFYVDYASVRVFLSPTLGTPFVLNSTTNGILNTNVLGYP